MERRKRSSTDGPGAVLETCPLRDTTDLRGWLTTSFTNREHEALFQRIRTDADIMPAQTPITAEETWMNPPECPVLAHG